MWASDDPHLVRVFDPPFGDGENLKPPLTPQHIDRLQLRVHSCLLLLALTLLSSPPASTTVAFVALDQHLACYLTCLPLPMHRRHCRRHIIPLSQGMTTATFDKLPKRQVSESTCPPRPPRRTRSSSVVKRPVWHSPCYVLLPCTFRRAGIERKGGGGRVQFLCWVLLLCR